MTHGISRHQIRAKRRDLAAGIKKAQISCARRLIIEKDFSSLRQYFTYKFLYVGDVNKKHKHKHK
jgi:hypothetical protein